MGFWMAYGLIVGIGIVLGITSYILSTGEDEDFGPETPWELQNWHKITGDDGYEDLAKELRRTG
mgnify:CR=1 FL=1